MNMNGSWSSSAGAGPRRGSKGGKGSKGASGGYPIPTYDQHQLQRQQPAAQQAQAARKPRIEYPSTAFMQYPTSRQAFFNNLASALQELGALPPDGFGGDGRGVSAAGAATGEVIPEGDNLLQQSGGAPAESTRTLSEKGAYFFYFFTLSDTTDSVLFVCFSSTRRHRDRS